MTAPDNATDLWTARQRAEKIKLLLMDVDGVFTTGTMSYFPDSQGEMVEIKGFNSQDGLGLHFLHKAGLRSGVISGLNSLAMTERARILNMTYVYQGHLAKIPVFEEILAHAAVTSDQVAFIGDDFTDAPLMARAGLAIAVSNARPEVKKIAHHVTQAHGGSGAVREVIELILKAQNKWTAVLEMYGLNGSP